MSRAARRTIASFAGFVLACGALVVTSSSADALIALPSFRVSPAPVVLGQPFSVQAGWRLDYYDPNSPMGCPNATDWEIDDPNGNLVATGHLDGYVVDPNGGPTQVSTGQGLIGLERGPGTYTISPTPDSAECGSGSYGNLPTQPIDVVYPDGYSAPAFTLSPGSQSHSVGQSATVTVSVADSGTGAPMSGVAVDFAVTGANSAATGTCSPAACVTDSTGTVTWTYAGTATGHDTVNAHLDGQSGPGTAAQTSVDWTHSVNGYMYAALGDSYSAGEGTYVYDPGTDQPNINMCHRSATLAYGPRLAAAHPATLGDIAHVACSGAVTDDLFNANHGGNQAGNGTTEPAQLCSASATVAACGTARLPALGPATTTVTVTIGGNDAGFSDVVKSCVWLSLGKVRVAKPGQPGCSLRSDVTVPLTRRLAALAGAGSAMTPASTPVRPYPAVLAALHRAAPNAHIYLTGYPRLFQDNALTDCTVGTATVNDAYGSYLKITALDAAYLDTMATLLNRAMANAAKAAGPWASYVDVTGRFTGHGLCSSKPWINPINGNATVNSGGYTVTISTEDAHPDVTGQAQGYQPALEAAGVGR